MHSTRCVAQSREQAKESHGNERKWETPTPERIREFHLNVWMRLHEGWHLDGIQDAKAASARFDQVARLVPCKPAPGGHAADPRDPQSPTNTQCPSALRFVQPYLDGIIAASGWGLSRISHRTQARGHIVTSGQIPPSSSCRCGWAGKGLLTARMPHSAASLTALSSRAIL